MAGFFSKNAAKAVEGLFKRSFRRAQHEWEMTKYEAKDLVKDFKSGNNIIPGLEWGLGAAPVFGLVGGGIGARKGHKDAKENNNGGFVSTLKIMGYGGLGSGGGFALSFAGGAALSGLVCSALFAPRVTIPAALAFTASYQAYKNSHVAQLNASREAGQQAAPVAPGRS